MPLSPEQLQRLSALLDEAMPLSAAQRQAWLASLPPADAALRERLQRLLDDSQPQPPLDRPPPLAPAAPLWQGRVGERVGPYELLAPLGRGGMGEVWRAARADGRFQREVALKLPLTRVGHDLAARLQFETQVAARLEHRHIARLYDAGLDEQGRPWIASELIDGEPLDTYAARLDLGQRLRLLIWVVRAVAYAHGRGVLHRDLKPANVRVDRDGVPHLLDFGIAVLTDAPGAPAREQPPAQRALTPRYAAPEQLEGAADAAQADVYSLGVIAYELLSGQRPPARPTASDWQLPSAVAAPPLARRLRGDLDAVVTRAMAGDPAERYETAALLADELERCQRGDPVLARPLGPLSRAGRTLRRHWLAGSATGAVLLALASGGTLSLVQAQRAEQANARERAAQAFVGDLLKLGVRGGRGSAEVLDRGPELVAARFPDQPLLQLRLLDLLAQSYAEMGDGGKVLQLHQRRWALLQQPGAREVPAAQRAQAQLALIDALLDRGLLDETEQLQRQLPPLQGEAALQAALQQHRLAFERGQIEPARSGLQALDAQLPAKGLLRAQWHAQRAELLRRDGQPDACIASYREAAASAEAGGAPAKAAELLGRAAYWAAERGLREQALALQAQAQAGLRAHGGAALVRAALDQAEFWSAMLRQPAATRAEALAGAQDALRQIEWLGDAVSPRVAARVQRAYGGLLVKNGDVEQGEAQIMAALNVLAAQEQRPLHRSYHHTDLAAIHLRQGRRAEAERALLAGLADRQQGGFGRHPYIVNVYMPLALNAAAQGDTARALAFLDSAPSDDQMRSAGHDPAWYRSILTKTRARVLLEAERPAEALALLADQQPHRFDRQLAGLPIGLPWLRGWALCALDRPREGTAAFSQAWQDFTRDAPAADAELQAARERSMACARRAGDAAAVRRFSAAYPPPAAAASAPHG